MSIIRLQHCFQGPSALPSDRFCNTFHLDTGSGLLEEGSLGTNIALAFRRFYGVAGHTSWEGYRARFASTPGRTIKMYDLADPKPRVARFDESDTPYNTAPTAQNLPSEACVVLAFQAEGTSGIRAARARGRVYLGPLNIQAMSGGGATPGTVSTTFSDLVLTNAITLRSELFALGVVWGIYSPTDAVLRAVHTVSVDNQMDVQQRRALPRTANDKRVV